MIIQVKKLRPRAKVPTKGHPNDAGWDLYSNETVSIPAGASVLILTGVGFAIPEGYAGLIWDRSSMGVKGLHRFAGVVDCGYRGEVKVCINNSGKEPYHIQLGDRVAQIIFQEIPSFDMIEVEELSETLRGDGGFGSTGK